MPQCSDSHFKCNATFIYVTMQVYAGSDNVPHTRVCLIKLVSNQVE